MAIWPFVSAALFAAQIPEGYYDSVDTSSAGMLRKTLHEVIGDHVRFKYTQGTPNCWDILEVADVDPTASTMILDIYRNKRFVKSRGQGNPYEREHSWPKSWGFPKDVVANYPYTDCHALFFADEVYNGDRSNKPYGTCSASCDEKPTEVNHGEGGGSGTYPGNSNWTTGSFHDGTWETWHDRRGDVARALFYMDVRYEGGIHKGKGTSEPDLILTDNRALIAVSRIPLKTNKDIAHMGLLSVLLEWHEQDPVDDKEQHRNDAVFSFQENRNPFIDHPEWVEILWGDDDDLDLVVTEIWINEIHYDDLSGDEDEFVEIAGPAGTSLNDWRLIGYTGSSGRSYDTVKLSGSISDQGGGFGTVAVDFAGLQNGSPDGIALVNAAGEVVEFLSYEGPMTGKGGPADGVASINIGVMEDGSLPSQLSLQRSDTGPTTNSTVWTAGVVRTRGEPNLGQGL